MFTAILVISLYSVLRAIANNHISAASTPTTMPTVKSVSNELIANKKQRLIRIACPQLVFATQPSKPMEFFCKLIYHFCGRYPWGVYSKKGEQVNITDGTAKLQRKSISVSTVGTTI